MMDSSIMCFATSSSCTFFLMLFLGYLSMVSQAHSAATSSEPYVWTEEVSLAPRGQPLREELPPCDEGEGLELCLLRGPEPMNWTRAHSYCRSESGFLASRSQYDHLTLWWPVDWWSEGQGNLTWTALTTYLGHYQWLGRSPSRSDFIKWRDPPKNWSRDCAALNLTTMEFQLTSCTEELYFFCVRNNSVALPDIDFSDVELKVSSSVKGHHGLIKMPEDDFDDLVLKCQAFSKSTGELLHQQPHIFWRKDKVYVDYSTAGLQPSTVFDSSQSEPIVPGISERKHKKHLSQGTYWCESWLPNSPERLESNQILVTLEEWVTLIFHVHRNEESSDNTRDAVKNELCNLFKSDFPNITLYTWDPISVEKEFNASSSLWLAKYIFHIHMPIRDLRLENLKNMNFLYKYKSILRDANFLRSSNLTFATFCYKQRKSFGSDKTLSWPFTKAGNVYPKYYRCKVKYGRLSPGVCRANYISGAYLDFDPSPCEWLDQCPVGYKRMKKYCISLSPPADWDTGFKDIYKTSQEFSILNKSSIFMLPSNVATIKNLTSKTYNLSKLWLPFKREQHFGPLVFQGPGSLDENYRKFDGFKNDGISWLEQHPRIDQDCLVFNLETKAFQTSDCHEKLPFLAIIDIMDSPSRKSASFARPSPHCTKQGGGACLCPPGWNTTLFKGENETCFKLFTNTGNVTWTEARNFCSGKNAQLPTPNVGFLDWVYRHHLYNEGVPSVWMGTEWIPDRIAYIGAEDNINWLPNTDYSLHYGALTPDGWILENDYAVKQNILCQQIIHQNVSFKLKVNEPRDKASQTMCIDVAPTALLMNEEKENLKCFVNGKELDHEHTEDSGCQFELKVSTQGYYHCKAWTRPPYMLVQSNTILHRDFETVTFVITLSLNEDYIPERHDSTFRNIHNREPECIENIRNDLGTSQLSDNFRFSHTLPFYTPNTNGGLLYNFHLECEMKTNKGIDGNELLGILRDYLKKSKVLQNGKCIFLGIRSTVGCESDVSIDYMSVPLRNLTWPGTVGRKLVTSDELCVTPNGDPVTRECHGDFLEGYYWASPQNCSGEPSEVTKNLWKLNVGVLDQRSSAKLVNLTSNHSSLLPVDIYLVAKAFHTLSEGNSELNDLDDIVKVLNNVMGANVTAFESVQRKLNSSSMILDAFEQLTFKVNLYGRDGDQKMKAHGDFASVERLDLEANSTIVGFKSEGYNKEELRVGFKNEELANADVAIILPNNLTYTVSSKSFKQPGNAILERKNEKVPLTFAVFQNEKLFHDSISHVNYSVNSPIVMASYQGEVIKDLDVPVKILFKPNKKGNDTKCVFWDFLLNEKRGGWSDEGCTKAERQGEHDVCCCNHLTNFAQLINYDDNSGFEGTHAMLLDLFTVIGCCLSIMGLLLVFTTFFLFKKWRRSLSNKILVNLSFSVFCSMVIFLAGINQTWNDQLCRSVAVGLHYFILASFGWMLVEAVHQYLKFVKVVGTYIPRFLWKASVCAWGIPVLPILCVLIYDHSLYDSTNDYNADFRICWMSVNGFKYAFLPPLVLTMTVNLIMYSLIIHGAICGRARVNSTMSERTLFMNQLRMAVCVFILLGFTWIFGLLAVCQLRQVFSYLFCIFNTLQGFFIFMCHICREQGARKYWKDFLSVLTKEPVSSTPGNSFNHINSLNFRGHPDSVSFDKCGGILVLPPGPPLRSHLRRTNRASIMSARTNSTLVQSRISFSP